MFSLIKSLFVPTIVLMLSAAYYLECSSVRPIDKMLIEPVCLLILILYFYFTVIEFFRCKKKKSVEDTVRNTPPRNKTKVPWKEGIILCMVALYIWIIQYLGFLPTTILFMASMLYILDVHEFWVIGCFSIASATVLYVAFKMVLLLPLPDGIWSL